MTRAALLAYIDNNVYPNANNEITALMVRDVLHRMVDFLGDAATYGVGDVAPSDPGLVTGGAVQGAINTALSSAIKFQGVTTTPLTDGSTDPDIVIAGDPYTARRGDEVIYGGREFLWTGSVWQQLGDEQSWALKTITISAGAGLTGGGNLTANRTISLSQDSLNKLALAASAYQLPQGGIPKTDLASDVQTTLGSVATIAGYFSGDKLKYANLPDLYLARTAVSGTAGNKTLYGVDGISHAAAADNTEKSRIVWDADNDAWHFYGNIYTDGWFSGGGISQGGGGGGGGIDPVAMWRLLTNDPSLTQYDNYTKISADHIVFPVTSVVGLTGAVSAAQIAAALGLGSLAYQSALTSAQVTNALGYTPVNPSSLGSFAYKNSLSVSDIPDLSGTYLSLSGGTMSNTNLVTNLNADLLDGFHEGSFFKAMNFKTEPWKGGIWSDYAAYGLYPAGDAGYINIPQWGGNTPTTFYTAILRFPLDEDIKFAYVSNTTSTPTWYTFYHSGNFNPANYLPLTGGTMSNTNLVANLNADLLDGFHEGSFFKAMNFKTEPWKGGIWSDYAAYGLYPAGDAGYINIPQWGGNTPTTFYTAILRFPLDGDIKFAYVSNTTSTPTWRTFYHTGNSNKSDVAWACSNLEASGVIHASTGIWTDGYFSGGGLSQSSDARLKTDIKDFAYSSRLLMSLRPKEWDWSSRAAIRGHAAGFVAQDVEPLMPYSVDKSRNYLALFYEHFHAVEISALQDHERRIAKLEKRLNMN